MIGGEILNYVRIPEEIIQDVSISEKRVIIFSYLCCRRSLDDTVAVLQNLWNGVN